MADLTPEQQYQKARDAEWGTYVATTTIMINGARAFNVGDRVPTSHVTDGVVSEASVARSTTKAGRIATGTQED